MIKLKKAFIGMILSFISFSIVGCKNTSQSSDEGSGSSSLSSETIETKKIIGAGGGTIKSSENDPFYTINISSGALNNDTEISVRFDSIEDGVIENGTSPTFGFLGDFTFEPSGTVFNKDIEVHTKLVGTPRNSELSIFCYCEETKVWDYVTNASFNNGVASFKINHFSEYKVLDLTPNMLSKHAALIREAKSGGHSDTWITEQFRDYLVNQCHVLDYYSEVGGYYYEPIGLQISGEYHLADGSEGNSDELLHIEGSDGKVGNRLGMAQFAESLTSSSEYHKKKDDPAYENQDISYVLVTITLDMIKPNIDLTAPKQKLSKGETVTVNVNCHYLKPTNPIYPDFPLPNYLLTLPYELQHFAYNKKEITTDLSGKASFTVTAIDEGTESLKVMFYVPGVFGEYASQFMQFTCGGYQISGHIVEEYKFSFFASGTDNLSHDTAGTATLTFEYDFAGTIEESNVGLVQFNNATAKISGTPAIESSVSSEGKTRTARYDFFQSVENVTSTSPTFNFNASVSDDNVCTMTASGNPNNIMTVSGSGTMGSEGMFIDVALTLSLTSKSLLLLPFSLERGSQTLESSALKDDFSGSSVWYGTTYSFGETVQVSSPSYKTIQTITIA